MFDWLRSLFATRTEKALFHAELTSGKIITVRVKVPTGFGLQEALFFVCAQVETKYGAYASVTFVGLEGNPKLTPAQQQEVDALLA